MADDLPRTAVPDMLGDYPRHRRWWVAPLVGTIVFALMAWANVRQIGVWEVDDANTASDHSGMGLVLMAVTVAEFGVGCCVWSAAAFPIRSADRAWKIRKAVFVVLALEILVFLGIYAVTGMSLDPRSTPAPQ